MLSLLDFLLGSSPLTSEQGTALRLLHSTSTNLSLSLTRMAQSTSLLTPSLPAQAGISLRWQTTDLHQQVSVTRGYSEVSLQKSALQPPMWKLPLRWPLE